MQLRHVKHPFPPIIDKDCTLLILGSVPSQKSCEMNFYYMHPQNRFWRTLSLSLGEELVSMDISARAATLLKHHIALYDSVEECDISGSSDSAISNVVPADIPALIAASNIRRILCNGAASYAYLIKYHPQLAPIAIKLPSTSPANAAFSLSALTSAWSPYLSSF